MSHHVHYSCKLSPLQHIFMPQSFSCAPACIISLCSMCPKHTHEGACPRLMSPETCPHVSANFDILGLYLQSLLSTRTPYEEFHRLFKSVPMDQFPINGNVYKVFLRFFFFTKCLFGQILLSNFRLSRVLKLVLFNLSNLD